ncbi:MAG TPA: aminotransferase class I/II-fold pyridoxal phosphate-dependent enzyme [Polyangiaceae bacterium]|nr:aminotransferase class I/II-fold pyridoxal phosphate-dependent enzyme [Polyangiaceae bacterium]
MEASEQLSVVTAITSEARERGLYFQFIGDERLSGRRVTVGGKGLLSFSSCSYLGLEFHPALVAGVHDAVDRYGTQFSASRGFLSVPLYEELESLLSRVFGGYALVSPSTSLGHQAALSALATEKDAILYDHQAHFSVQCAVNLVRSAGAHVELVHHADFGGAIERAAELARRHRTVWFACDGVYSMYGDTLSAELVRGLLDAAPNVRLYVDDAHGMSWAGEHGRGSFLSRFGLSDRVVVATSLNKAYAAGGGCLVFATREEREWVRNCIGALAFSGPLQPPMLGAAVASAKVHLSDEIYRRQAVLRERVTLANRLLREAQLDPLVENETPIFFLPLGAPQLTYDLAGALREAHDIHATVALFPGVPVRRSGLRLAITAAHSEADIRRLVGALEAEAPAVFERHGATRERVRGRFRGAIRHAAPPLAVAAPGPHAPAPQAPAARPAVPIAVEVHRSIRDVDRALWDGLLGAAGACSWDALATAEDVFRGHGRREHDWDFHYVLARHEGRVVGATFFTTALNKDDMLMREEVSLAVERRRESDPYFLTSLVTMAGSLLSEGDHLYLDRAGPWREALAEIVRAGLAIHDAARSNALIFRDLPEADTELGAALAEHGFSKVPMPDSHRLELTFASDDELAASLSKRKRQYLREQAARAGHFVVERFGHGAGRTLDPAEARHLHALYLNVASRKRRINVFPLPERVVEGFLTSPSWEVVTLRLRPECGGPADGAPVAWYAAHVSGGHYMPFLCGLDYRYVTEHGVYRQTLYQMVRRARECGASVLHLGMDADFEKSRYGSTPVRCCVYVQARDHFNAAVLRDLVANVASLEAPRAAARIAPAAIAAAASPAAAVAAVASALSSTSAIPAAAAMTRSSSAMRAAPKAPSTSAIPAAASARSSSAFPAAPRAPSTSATPAASRAPSTSVIPAASRAPSTSAIPAASRAPSTSAIPAASRTPSSSAILAAFRAPSTSAIAAASKAPSTSAILAASRARASSAMPAAPRAPSTSAAPAAPSTSSASTTRATSAMRAAPKAPSASAMPAAPKAPSSSAMPAAPKAPSSSAMPAAPVTPS